MAKRKARTEAPAAEDGKAKTESPARAGQVPAPQGSSPIREAARPQPSPAAADRGAAMPLDYGRDDITAVVRDPNCIFVYWENQGVRRAEAMRRHGKDVFEGARWVLRIHSETSEPPQDVPIVADGGNWYLHVPEDRGYVVEIGIVTRAGDLVILSRSNAVRTPRKNPSDDGSCEWMLVEGDFQRVVRLTNGHPPIQVGEFAVSSPVPLGSSGFAGPRGLAAREHVGGSMSMGSAALQKPKSGR